MTTSSLYQSILNVYKMATPRSLYNRKLEIVSLLLTNSNSEERDALVMEISLAQAKGGEK